MAQLKRERENNQTTTLSPDNDRDVDGIPIPGRGDNEEPEFDTSGDQRPNEGDEHVIDHSTNQTEPVRGDDE